MTPCLEVIIQKDAGDCALASLAMLLGRSYREVSDLARTLVPKVHEKGLWTSQILLLADALGQPLRKLATIPEHDSEPTGVLTVGRGKGKKRLDHAVTLFQGVVIDPLNGLVWDLDAYLEQGWTITGWHPLA